MKIRIINLDSYMGTPIANLDVFYSEFRGSAVNQVPIIRIYGSTEEGQKICLHIHGVFPYIYVPYDGSTPADGFLYQVASGLDKAINLSLGQASSNVQHIYKVSLVSGIPFYGYHAKQHQFLKLYFYNPLIVKKACNLLQNGSILGKIYQPHEAHIPYILQFMIDYNLHGMSFIDLADIKYRVDPKQQNEYPENSTLPLSVQKMSVCKLEGDVQADLILNRLEITPGHLTVNPGIKALWEDEKQRLRNNDELSLVEHCLTQNRIEIPPTATHIAYKKILEEKLQMKSRTDDSSSESDLSVYPAETPPSLDLLDASVVEKHISTSQETDDSLLDETIVENQNETTLNEDAKNLYDLLERMKEDNIEPDSILSQKHEECASDQEDIDLSLPLNATLTPKKIESNCDDSHDFLNDSYFNTLAKIPQLDGAFDEETEGEQILEQDPNNNQNNSNFGLPYKVKANRRKTENSSALMNQRKYLDGTNDSSSEDENTTKPTPKKISKMSKSSPRSASRYSPLQVQHRASPKKASQTTFPKTHLQNQNPPMVSFTKQVLVQTTKDDSKLKSDHPQFRHKRKLSFSDASPLNRTQLEEGLVCSYKSKPPSKRAPLPADEPTQNPYIPSKLNQQYLIPTNPKELAPSLLTPYQKVTSDTIDTNQSDESMDSIKFSDSSGLLSDDIFSPDLQDASGDPAESYDIQNKFIPLAGSSKLLPNPSDANRPTSALDNIQSSAETVCDATLSGKSFFTSDNSERSNAGNLTPYQKQNIEEKGTITSEINAESSESEVTPYQRSFITEVKANLSVCEHFERIDSTESLGPVILVPKFNPPTRDFVISTLEEYNIPEVHHQEPFYSDVKDVTGAMEVGMKVLRIPSDKLSDLPEFQSNFKGLNHYRRTALEQLYPNEKLTNKEICNYKMSFCKNGDCVVTPARLPPSREDVELWLRNRLENKPISADKTAGRKKIFIPRSPGGGDDDSNDSMTISPCTPLDETIKNIGDSAERHPNHSSKLPELNITKDKNTDPCQITGVTLNNSDNFAISCNNLQEAKALNEYLHLTILCIELIVETRGDYKPNPAHDSVRGIVFKIFNDLPEDTGKRSETGCFLLNNTPVSPTKTKFSILDGIVIDNFRVKLAQSEEELFKQFIGFVTETDPDILVGYEIEMLSWGYLIERGYILNLNLIALLSRIPNFVRNKPEDGVSDLTIPGRIVLDFWRLLRHEIALQSYSFENIVYHVLRERVPVYSFKDITYWWNHPSALYRNKVLKYYFYRVESVLKIAEQLDLIGRTSELAKLFGLQFFEVLSRGSQFRVESMMLRLAKPLNYIPVSPSVQQRAKMRAPETLPLIMEPESKFYADPVIVLDFQSLYPSMMIAYNYCFSTSLGRVEHLGQNSPYVFGATQLKVPRRTVKYLHRKDLINISPCGVAFVKKRLREGILPKMLQEILDTRLMVKKALKRNSGNRTLSRVLDARQLGLKLIANVTYGYTAANFSGRMPCVEVADSVVSKGRETLQRAIDLVEKTRKWRARVVYGDTDSLFVLVAGRSREDAFKIGAEIAEAVTEANPSPVRLKLEKVFHPCVLQTKKRYVGYMYESPEQKQPEYCAKGIETVRRDGCPAVSKMLEKCLKLLFDTRDVSLIRSYVTRQFSKILSGRISIQDLTFAKEYRGSSGYRPGACVPALELARKWTATDKRNEPRRSERVPYVIINGPPGLPLIRLVRSPRELIADPSLRPNALYYITKVIIPPLNRCFLLIGADANNWFNDMPKKQFQYLYTSSPVKGKKSTISQYFSTKNCVICNQQSKDGLCDACITKTQDTSAILHEKIRLLEQHCFETKTICQSCCDSCDKISCVSLDCPVYYKRVQTEKEYHQVPFIRELLLTSLPDLGF